MAQIDSTSRANRRPFAARDTEAFSCRKCHFVITIYIGDIRGVRRLYMGVNGGPNGPAAGNQDTGWTGFREGKNFPPPADMAVPGAYNLSLIHI